MSGQLTWQIRWTAYEGDDLKGSVGTLGYPLFTITTAYNSDEYVLLTSLEGGQDMRSYDADPDALKVRAEEWLRDWLAKLGKQVLTEAAERA